MSSTSTVATNEVKHPPPPRLARLPTLDEIFLDETENRYHGLEVALRALYVSPNAPGLTVILPRREKHLWELSPSELAQYDTVQTLIDKKIQRYIPDLAFAFIARLGYDEETAPITCFIIAKPFKLTERQARHLVRYIYFKILCKHGFKETVVELAAPKPECIRERVKQLKERARLEAEEGRKEEPACDLSNSVAHNSLQIILSGLSIALVSLYIYNRCQSKM